MDCYAKGLSVSQTIIFLNSYEYNTEKYQEEWLESINELKNREQHCDTKISDIIEHAYKNGEPLFHTLNHPKKKLMNEHCNRILDYIGLSYNRSASEGECLESVRLSTNIIYTENPQSSVAIWGDEISQDEFVKKSFSIYHENGKYIKLYLESLQNN